MPTLEAADSLDQGGRRGYAEIQEQLLLISSMEERCKGGVMMVAMISYYYCHQLP